MSRQTAFFRWLLVMLCLLSGLLASPAWARAEVLTLAGGSAPIQLAPALEYWIDSTGQATVEKVESGANNLAFSPTRAGQTFLLDNAALWLRFEAVVRDPQRHWKLEVPVPGLDKATLYYRNLQGFWVVQEAGDSLAMSAWPQPGRYPVFSLSPDAGQSHAYYLRIVHGREPFSVLPNIAGEALMSTEHQSQHLLLGAYFGLAILVIFLALVNAAVYRDWGFASYAVYAAALAGTLGAFTGIAGLYWWPALPALNNFAVFLLPPVTTAAALWFVRTVTSPKRFSRALDWFILGLMGLLPVIGALDAAFPTAESFALINILISASMLVVVTAVGVSLYEGDRTALWIALGFLPIVLATLFPLLRNFGIASSGFLSDYALMLGAALEAPILFYGLLLRVTQRRGSTSRAKTLRLIDPLTGLGTGKYFLDKLRQAFATAQRYQHPCAVLLVNLSNLASLQQEHGREVGDRAMVMAAARLRVATQSTDSVARIGDSYFAVLTEGPMTSASVNQMATKILASGLRPAQDLPDAAALRFHIAIGYMTQPVAMDANQTRASLLRVIQAVKEMDVGSPKAIRLLYL